MGKLADQSTEKDQERQKETVPHELSTNASPSNKFHRLKQLVRSPKFLVVVSAVLLAVTAVIFFVNPVKFALLNLVASGEIKFVIVDDTTLAPVNNAKITLGSKSTTTDKNGKATVKGVNFGESTYTIQKETYVKKTGKHTIKPGNNLVGPIKLHSDGYPVEIHVINKLSQEVVKDFTVSISSTNISSRSNKEGKAILKLPSNRLSKQNLSIAASGFNTTKQTIDIKTDQKQKQLSLSITPAGKHYFLSNRDGKLGVYASDLDGSNQTLIIAGTNSSEYGAQLAVSPNGRYGALVSTRDNLRGADGNVIPALYSIDFEAKTVKRIDEGAPTFSILGWADDTTLAYQVVLEGYDRPDRNKLKSANITTGKLSTIVALPGFPNFYHFDGDPKFVYASLGDATKSDYGVYSFNIATKSKQRLFDSGTYSLMQIKPYIVSFQGEATGWHELNLRTKKVQKLDTIPDSGNNTTYRISDDRKKIAWLENRDGKGTVIVGDQDGNNAEQVTRSVTASIIVGWKSNDYILFTSITATQSTDYIVHIATGTTTKISDVYSIPRHH